MTRSAAWSAFAAALALIGAAVPARAATLCVKPGGGGGCYKTIGGAVAAAGPGDTVNVAPGTYHESVVIAKSVALVGHNREDTIIDASGLAYGIEVGMTTMGVDDVSIRGFTIRNANFEGILVVDSKDVTIANNELTGNNHSLDFAGGTCPGILPPDSEAGEGFDCGEAIHLTGTAHSTIASNIIKNNAGGILLSDDTGPTHDVLVSGNIVVDNVFDCGVTLASHKPVAPNGVYHNTIAANDVSGNGTQGQGAGVGLFTPIPGTATYGNIVIGNRAVGNGLPGVAMHSHAPGQNLNDNQIIGNFLAKNGADDDAQTPGTAGIIVFGVSPITGTIISRNVIDGEDIGIAVKTGSDVDIHLNDLNNHKVGVANLGPAFVGGAAATIDAIDNWWGCPHGPGTPGCASTSGPNIETAPWLRRPE